MLHNLSPALTFPTTSQNILVDSEIVKLISTSGESQHPLKTLLRISRGNDLLVYHGISRECRWLLEARSVLVVTSAHTQSALAWSFPTGVLRMSSEMDATHGHCHFMEAQRTLGHGRVTQELWAGPGPWSQASWLQRFMGSLHKVCGCILGYLHPISESLVPSPDSPIFQASLLCPVAQPLTIVDIELAARRSFCLPLSLFALQIKLKLEVHGKSGINILCMKTFEMQGLAL